MQRHGWTLLFHECVIEQLRKLQAAAEKAEQSDPQGFEGNANVKLFRALSQLIVDVVPSDPARDEFRQGNTLGAEFRHWRRAKVGRRFRLFFATTRRRKPSSMHGSMTSRPCDRRAASRIRTLSLKRCWGEAVHPMIGRR